LAVDGDKFKLTAKQLGEEGFKLSADQLGKWSSHVFPHRYAQFRHQISRDWREDRR
jgi:hypothetical protein